MRTGLEIQRKKILIIDDDTDLLDILKEFMSSCGFNTRVAESATDIFQIIEQFKPDLIVLDYLLNGINGGEICHQIKTSVYGKYIPVIIYSAYPKVLLSLGTYGCDLFISKPFDLDFFVRSTKQLLQSNPLQQTFNSAACKGYFINA